MAKNLNKNRMRDTRILVALTIFVGFFCSTLFPSQTVAHEAMEMAGYVLVIACAIGRVYSTAFIGGVKNEDLITWGPYSLCRNPLYFFSLLGAAGIGLTSTSLFAFVVIFTGFLLIYRQLIRREEEFLAEKFEKKYQDYVTHVPRLIPRIDNYACPDELLFQPRFLNKSMADAIWWFVPLPLFELSDILHEKGLISPLFSLF